MKQDARIPVMLGQQAGPGDLLLAEDGQATPEGAFVRHFTVQTSFHGPGCACCVARSPAAAALAAAFRARATGAAPFFNRVVVLATAAGRQEVKAALAVDVFCQARFRLLE